MRGIPAAAEGFPLGGQIIIRRATLNSNKASKKNSRIFINSGGTDHNQAYILIVQQTMGKNLQKPTSLHLFDSENMQKL